MSEKTDKFISVIAPLAINEYLTRDKWVLPSICIAQAALESGWNLNASTLFGIKGDGIVKATTEYYNGKKETIVASFKAFPSVADAVIGYYDFLTSRPRYGRVVNNPDYKSAVHGLIDTLDGESYATDPDYESKVDKIIEQYHLTQYDKRDNVSTTDVVNKEVPPSSDTTSTNKENSEDNTSKESGQETSKTSGEEDAKKENTKEDLSEPNKNTDEKTTEKEKITIKLFSPATIARMILSDKNTESNQVETYSQDGYDSSLINGKIEEIKDDNDMELLANKLIQNPEFKNEYEKREDFYKIQYHMIKLKRRR